MEKFPRSTFEATIGRGASTIGGGVLLAYGFRRGSRRGAVLALCGVELACRGLTGRSPYRCLRGEPQQREGARATIPYRRGIRIDEATTINPLNPSTTFGGNSTTCPTSWNTCSP